MLTRDVRRDSERFHCWVQTHRDYLSWLRGLIPECDLITASINEVTPIYLNMLQGGQLQCPTKQLNSDFLAGARLGVIKHPRAAMLFPTLTNAYRDVVHTNEMMTRYEIRFDRAIASINPRADLLGILQGVCACMPVVRASVQALRHATQEQQQLEEDHPPTIWDVD
jgi:hypothetical protein